MAAEDGGRAWQLFDDWFENHFAVVFLTPLAAACGAMLLALGCLWGDCAPWAVNFWLLVGSLSILAVPAIFWASMKVSERAAQ